MAGILLCQMFVFGVSKTSADAREVAKKMSFEVVGEGIVTVTDTAENEEHHHHHHRFRRRKKKKREMNYLVVVGRQIHLVGV